MEQYDAELLKAINAYLESVGVYVDLNGMTQAERQAFFRNPPEGVNQDELETIVQSTLLIHGTEDIPLEYQEMAVIDPIGALGFLGIGKIAKSIKKGIDEVFDFFRKKDDEIIQGGKAFDPKSLSPEDRELYDALLDMGENPADWGFAGEEFVIVDEAGVPKVKADEAIIGDAPEFDIDTPLKTDPDTGKSVDIVKPDEDFDYVQGSKPNVEVPEGGPVPGTPKDEFGTVGPAGAATMAIAGEATGVIPSIGGAIDTLLTGGEDDEFTLASAEDSQIFNQETTQYAELFPHEGMDKAKGILKEIYFESLSEQQAFDKLTNWISNTTINTPLVANGQPLLNALMEKGGSLANANFLNIKSAEGKYVVKNYLLQNWRQIPELAQQIEGQFAGGGITPEQAIDYYIDTMAQRSEYFLILQDNADLGSDGLPTNEVIAIVPSYDGTPFGEIVSLNDLMSGGKLGSFNISRLLDNGTTTPEQIELWQQQLFAWGFLQKPPPVWGVSDQETANAMNAWHVQVFNEGLKLANNGQQLSPDGSPLADAVQNNAIKTRLQGMREAGTPESLMRQEVTDDAFTRIQQYLNNTGRMVPQGARKVLEKGIEKVLNEMNPSVLEDAFGQGGNQAQRALAETFFKEYYGTEDWGSQLKFGNSDNDKDYFNYALKSGALSPQELTQLENELVRPQDYRRLHGNQNFEKEKDVAVATFLGYLQEKGVPGQSLENASIQAIASAIDTYMHTAGASRYRDNPLSSQDTLMMAARVKEQLRTMIFDDNVGIKDAAYRAGIDQFGLEGGVAGYQYRELVNRLDQITPGPQGLVTRNV